jgi:hypothetical protein
LSTIDPSKITRIRFKGVVLTGRILSVGVDGIYNYNYSHPQDALNAAINDDIILIYPGTYSPKSGLVLSITKDIRVYIRGMGETPNEVILTTPDTIDHTIIINYTNATKLFVAIENLTSIANKAWRGALVHRQCSASTITILNKLYLSATNYGYSIYFGDSVANTDYKGDCYITNCSLERGTAHFLEVGTGSTTSIISVQKTQYMGGAYNCSSCLRNPFPNDYVTSNTVGYGYFYGGSFFEISIDPIFTSDTYYKRNIWFKDPYIYKATASGVNIYNATSQSLIKRTTFPSGANSVWANDSHFYIGTSISGVYRCLINTISGTPVFEKYKSYPDITANNVNYLHGRGDYLCTATVSGVDRYKLSDDTRIYTNKDYVSKCFQTSNGDYYYVVNPFNNVLDLDDNIFGWDYGRTIVPSSIIPTNNYQFIFEIPLTQPDDIYRQTQQDGADIRIIDDKGVTLPYYIDLWDYSNPPIIWTTLSSGTEMFYMLYGNSAIVSRYNQESSWFGNPTISGYTISRGQGINDLFNAAELHAVYNSSYEYVYESKQGNLLDASYISDLYVTEGTSSYGEGNVIFLATSWGATVIEEKRGDEANATKRVYLISS